MAPVAALDAWMLLIQMAMAGMLAWSCFCRLTRTDPDTVREVRLVIWFEALAAGLVMGAPVMPWLVPEIKWEPGATPIWIWITLLLASTLVRIVMSRTWRNGIPQDYQKAKKS